MPATTTLSSTTLAANASAFERSVKVADTSGLTTGIYLYVNGELMQVVGLDGSHARVLRGVGGTTARAQRTGDTVYIGRGDQFYSRDPKGRPEDAIEVSPWINAADGSVWFAQGFGADRRWEKQLATYGAGSLGVATVTLSPTSST